jgi:glycosyltransferase involved in cell wall biosynthesis
MPKLLIIATVPTMIRAFLLPFSRHYRALGWQVDAAANQISELTEIHGEFDACYDLPLTRNPTDLKMMMQAPTIIRRIVEQGQYDIVHVHSPIAAFLVRFALKDIKNKPKVVYTAHGFHFHKHGKPLTNFIFKMLEKIAAPWCDVLITINKEDFQAAKNEQFATRIELMAGIGVDTQCWQASSVTTEQVNAVRESLNLSKDSVLFLMIAEFNEGKRHRDVLYALAQTDACIHVAFAGIGKIEQEIRLLAEQLSLKHRVHFLGFRRDIPVLICASRAVLLPSEREGLPRSLLEAMSLGVPIIGSDIRGITELAEERCGLLHDMGNPIQIAQAISLLAKDNSLAQEMGNNARQKVLKYDVKEIIRQHDILYHHLLSHFSSISL